MRVIERNLINQSQTIKNAPANYQNTINAINDVLGDQYLGVSEGNTEVAALVKMRDELIETQKTGVKNLETGLTEPLIVNHVERRRTEFGKKIWGKPDMSNPLPGLDNSVKKKILDAMNEDMYESAETYANTIGDPDAVTALRQAKATKAFLEATREKK